MRRQDWAPCESCDCVDGEAPHARWKVAGEPLFPDGNGGYTSETRSCPRRLVTLESTFLISLYRHYQAGHLYQAGGIADQPAQYLRLMQTIEVALNDDSES